MTVDEAHKIVRDSLQFDPGRFFSEGANLSLGVGKFYAGIRIPVFNPEDSLFLTAFGSVLVLTHECDVDLANARIFNDYVLACPVIPFEGFVAEYSHKLGDARLRGFLVELVRRSVSRVFFIPWGLAQMPYGGLIYLNQICHTHVSMFSNSDAVSIGATTAYGLQLIDQMLENHLFRPKTERLALQP